MVTIKRIKKDKPNYGDYKLYSVEGFVVNDNAICLVSDENGEVIWITEDQYIIVLNPADYKYSCSCCDVTIGEFLQVTDECRADDITAIIKDKKDFKINFEYFA